MAGDAVRMKDGRPAHVAACCGASLIQLAWTGAPCALPDPMLINWTDPGEPLDLIEDEAP